MRTETPRSRCAPTNNLSHIPIRVTLRHLLALWLNVAFAVCLILIAYQPHAKRPLVVAANRDEFYARPAEAAHWWPDAPSIFGGRDVRGRGTWLATSRDGRLAAVTNWTVNPARAKPAAKSRGDLPRRFLAGGAAAIDFAQAIDGRAYAGFNFIAYDGGALVYHCNRTGETRSLAAGVYGLTNTRLGTAIPLDATGGADGHGVGQRAEWPKAQRGARALAAIAATAGEAALLALLYEPEEHAAPVAGRPERSRARPFLRGAEYGTRASTAVIFEGGRVRFVERQYGPLGQPGKRTSVGFQIRQARVPAPPATLRNIA